MQVRSILLNWLPWLLMMKRPGYKFSRHLLTNPFKSQPSQQSSSQTTSSSRHSESLIRNVLGWESDTGKIHKLVDEHRRTSIDLEARVLKCLKPMLHDPTLVEPGVQAVLLVMQRIHSQLKFITKRMEEEDEEQDAETDWKFAAMVVDRLCLYLFTVFIIVSTVGIMFSAPHLIA
jgi:nicotinic acetylcholine receptor